MQTATVAAIGGSLLSQESSNQLSEWETNLCDSLSSGCDSGGRYGIVVGGGTLARNMIADKRKLGVDDEFTLDLVGIDATRSNALYLRNRFADAGIDVASNIPHSIDEAASELSKNSVVVMGGTVPGHTTDAVSIMLGIKCDAERVLIATNVSHVYTKDPRKHVDATPIERMTLTQLVELNKSMGRLKAGSSSAVDPIGAELALDAKMPLAVLDGRDSKLLGNALTGLPFAGTQILPEVC